MFERVSFLLGSGVSIPAGMPSVEKITKKVLSATEVWRHTDGTYCIGSDLSIEKGYVDRVTKFLKILYAEITQYYNSRRYDVAGRIINYEDLYYTTLQIYQSEMGSHENPIVQPFIDKIFSEIEPLFKGKKNEIKKSWELYEIAEEARNYIHDIVSNDLRNGPKKNTSYMRVIGDLCRDMCIIPDVFTLNHDTVIESYLDGSGIQFTDGFELTESGYSYWAPDIFEHSDHKIRLFKLHGSWNWFRYNRNAVTGKNDPVGKAVDGRYWLKKDRDGEIRWRDCGRSIMLIGTYNKIPEYTNRIFADLFCQFRCTLRKTNLLIVTGYGFGDQGIDSQIAEWANTSDKSIMVVIHKNPDDLKRGATGIIGNNWDKWLHEKKLLIVEKWIENTSSEDITNILSQ